MRKPCFAVLFLGMVHSVTLAEESPAVNAASTTTYAPLPSGITSFGAAILEDALYVYGGHKGRAHHYYQSGQVNELWKLDLTHPRQWDVVIRGPHLQGLAMIAYGGMLYRIGGFTARNEEDEDPDLRSVADVVAYDPNAKEWEPLTALPEPRSSHDAVVIGDHVYVVGGWQLSGESSERWHRTAYQADLSRRPLQWQALPEPPFQRRALSLGTLDGKLYVIGGMQQEEGPTTRVDIYDPADRTWSLGPSLMMSQDNSGPDSMEGFGSAAFAVGNRLFVSTYSGNLQSLKQGAKQWTIAGKLKEARFFHRMLPYRGKLLLIGGASMTDGRRLRFEEIDVANLE